VKVEPHYDEPVVWVKDASRAVGVAQNLISELHREKFVAGVKAEYEAVRERHAGRQAATQFVSLEEARANRVAIDWTGYTPPEPKDLGVTTFDDIPLENLVPYIDWTFFFHAWELKGRYPNILEDELKGEEARKLFEDAQQMLKQIIDGKWLTARAVVGMFAANATDDDDVIVYEGDDTEVELTRLHFLRKQTKQPPGKPYYCLSDYVAPQSSGKLDYVGMFACTTGLGIDEKIAEFEAAHDDYSAIMLKAIADRLAEACAEWLHLMVRREEWGYEVQGSTSVAGGRTPGATAQDEIDYDALIREQYQGIRPALGYPASPDHTEKDIVWQLLDVQAQTGIWLTESKAMVPTAAVSGLYFSHPESRYFAVGKINREQVEDYARRKGMSVEDAELWLGPNLGYDAE
jgi:5-methyltetrahydrofolate--homocysteine methyltransferase